VRSNRYAMVVDKDMKVEAVMVENGGYGETSAESVLKFLKA
jgi:peroxiredoxin